MCWLHSFSGFTRYEVVLLLYAPGHTHSRPDIITSPMLLISLTKTYKKAVVLTAAQSSLLPASLLTLVRYQERSPQRIGNLPAEVSLPTF